jgi:hypothetical protein
MSSKPEAMWRQLKILSIIIIGLFLGKTMYSAQVNNSGICYEYHAKLFGTYHLWRPNGFEAVIDGGTKKEPVSVNGNVAYYAVKEPYITGFAVKDYLPVEFPAVEGFFLIDTTKDTLKEGMTEKEWKEELSHVGWSNPHLVTPPKGFFELWRL